MVSQSPIRFRVALHCLFVFACAMDDLAVAGDKNETVATPLQLNAEQAKGSEFRDQLNDLVALVKAKQFADADAKAVELRRAYEATFNPKLKQYTFTSEAEFREFGASSHGEFEWIDW